jgi:hypothetical protein
MRIAGEALGTDWEYRFSQTFLMAQACQPNARMTESLSIPYINRKDFHFTRLKSCLSANVALLAFRYYRAKRLWKLAGGATRSLSHRRDTQHSSL